MVFVTISLTAGYIYKEVRKRRLMNTAKKEKEVIMENFRREFNEKYRRACNISKLRTKKRIKKMLGIKSKYKR